MIGLKKALEMMRRKDEHGQFVPFSVTMVTCNRSKKSGGELLELKNVTLPHRERVELDTMERREIASKLPAKERGISHFKKGTINFKLPNGDLRMGHIHLMTRYNGERII
jgi:hypothetical protein